MRRRSPEHALVGDVILVPFNLSTYNMIFTSALFAALALFTTPPHDPLPDLTIGTALPAADVMMKDVSGKERSLKEVAGKSGLLVVFSCNTCPFVVGTDDSEGWEGRYPELAAYASRHGVGVAFVNSNEAKRDAGDSFADMQKRYTDKKYNGSYLLDAGHVVADAFGARTTPHVFLFDGAMKLAYKGAIDDNVGSAAAVKEKWLHNAIDNLSAGKAIEPAVTRNVGCSIKRIAKEHKH